MCPYCNYSSQSDAQIQAHIGAAHAAGGQSVKDLLCPLCQDSYKTRGQLERHLCASHHVSVDAMQRLIMLVDPSAPALAPADRWPSAPPRSRS